MHHNRLRERYEWLNWMENGKEGVIVNTISTGGLNGANAGVVYGASKHAVDGGLDSAF